MNENTTDKPASQATDDPRDAGRSSNGSGCWTLVSDKLPKAGQDVWYFFEFCGVFAGKYFGMCEILEGCPEYGEDHHFGGKHGNLVGDVTHWMPLTDKKPDSPF